MEDIFSFVLMYFIILCVVVNVILNVMYIIYMLFVKMLVLVFLKVGGLIYRDKGSFFGCLGILY